MRKTKWLYGAVFALALAVPLYAWAASENGGQTSPSPNPSSSPPSTEGQAPVKPWAGGHSKKFFHHGRGFGILHDGVHEQTYLRLLSEKYAPDLVQQWKAVFDERKGLIEQLKSLAQNGVKGRLPLKPATPPSERSDDWKQTYQTFTEAVRSGDAAAIGDALKKLLDQYKAQNEALKQKLETLRQSAASTPSPSPSSVPSSPSA